MIRITPYKGREDAWLVDIRVRLPTGLLHRERYKSPCRTLKSTRTWAERREGEILANGPRQVASDVPTLAKFSERWIEEHAKANKHKASSVDKMRSSLRLHILPELGTLRLDEIDAASIQKFKATLAGKRIETKFHAGVSKLSPKSINNILSDLSGMLAAAVEWQVIPSAPHVKLLRAARRKMEFYELDDYARLSAGAEKCGAMTLALIRLAGDAGLRRGELVALEHRDIDHKRGTITVERSQWRDVVDLPKGGRSRRVPITPELSAALKAIPGVGTARVLRNASGSPLNTIECGRMLRRAQAASDLDATAGLHKLRHTFGSHLAMAGVPIIVIKELMGHQSIQTTEGYMHLAPASEAEGIKALAKLRAQAPKAPREIQAE